MIDLQKDHWINTRKRFLKWAETTINQLEIMNCCVVLFDQRGYILESINMMKANLNEFDLLKANTNVLDIIHEEQSLVVSLNSNHLEFNLLSPLFCTHHIQAASAACPAPLVGEEFKTWLGFITFEPAYDVKFIFNTLWQSYSTYMELEKERQYTERLSLLLDMGRTFHGRIDVNDVLQEVINWMKARFSIEQYDLLLSQDHSSLVNPLKPLVIQHPNSDLCSRSFLEGQLLFETSNTENGMNYTEVAAPLKGNQGIYGIIHLHLLPHDRVDDEIAFISMLADNAGKAFEVAKLYEQSNSLIAELRIINEITKRLNQSLQLSEIFSFACDELTQIFSADYCCILLADTQKTHLVVQASNAEAFRHEKFDIDYGFAGSICRSKEPIIISDYQHNNSIESKLMNVSQARSLIGSPVIINGETVGAILLVHRRSHFFSYDNLKMLQVLSGHIGLAITNATLHSEVRRMVITDQLTGLYVRHYLYEQIHLLQRKQSTGCLIVLDIDDFKKINDNYGHQIGDQILIKVCSIINQNIRDTDIAARWGGEEFAIYLPLMSTENAHKVADRIRKHVYGETNPTVSISSGIASWSYQDDEIGVDHLFHQADIALYEAKKSGKNKIRISK